MRKIIPVLLLLLIINATGTAQHIFSLKEKDREIIENLPVLPDNGYTFEQVLNDSSLIFDTAKNILPGKSSIYWIKCIVYNPSKYAVNYNLYVHPYLDNSFYLYDDDQKK